MYFQIDLDFAHMYPKKEMSFFYKFNKPINNSKSKYHIINNLFEHSKFLNIFLDNHVHLWLHSN